MDPKRKIFGRGHRELGGAVDLINHYKLLAHHEYFCKRSIPMSILETHYLRNVVGDTEIRKGEGMELDQLFHNPSYLREAHAQIHPFELGALNEAFHFRDTSSINLPSTDKGTPTGVGKLKTELKDKERKHKRHRDKDHKKHKSHHGQEDIRNGHPDHLKKHSERKTRPDKNENASDLRRHQQRKVRVRFPNQQNGQS